MAKNAEEDLLVKILASNETFYSDFKTILGDFAKKYNGTFKLLVNDYYNDIRNATFTTKLTDSKGKVINTTLEISLSDFYGSRTKKSIKVYASRAGYKGEKKYNSSNTWFYNKYNVQAAFEYTNIKNFDSSILISTITTHLMRELKNAAKLEEAVAKRVAKQALQRAEMKAEILSEYGFIECDIVNEMYERSAKHCRTKRQVLKTFDLYAKLLKIDPNTILEQQDNGNEIREEPAYSSAEGQRAASN